MHWFLPVTLHILFRFLFHRRHQKDSKPSKELKMLLAFSSPVEVIKVQFKVEAEGEEKERRKKNENR